MSELWPALKLYLGMGATGATAVLMTILWVKQINENRRLNEERVASEKEHGKDMMKLQSESAKEVIGIVHQYDQSLSSVNQTLDKLLAKEG